MRSQNIYYFSDVTENLNIEISLNTFKIFNMNLFFTCIITALSLTHTAESPLIVNKEEKCIPLPGLQGKVITESCLWKYGVLQEVIGLPETIYFTFG